MCMKNKILEYRNEIDKLDKQIVKLINKRANFALEIGKIKKEISENIYVPKRESQVLENVVNSSNGIISDDDLKLIYKQIMLACKNIEK